MEELIFIGYEVIAALLPFFIAVLAFHKIYKNKGIDVSICHRALVVIFAVYIVAVFHFTGTGTLYDILLYQLEIKQGQINIVPFIHDIDVVAYLQNVLLFLPLGFLLPAIWEQFNKTRNIILSGFSFSLFIEMSQLFNNRRTDIDDLILNTLGAILGFLIYRIYRIIRKSDITEKYDQWEPVIYICVLFVGKFLLFYEMGLAKLLYGF